VKPAISILMSCYNSEATVSASVHSVLEQTFPDWELIVVDDESSDRSVAVLEGFDDRRIRVFHQKNAGWPAARNNGLTRAGGDLVAFLDSDDTWHANFLERMREALLRTPDAVLAYCGWQNLGLPGGRGEPFVPPEYDSVDRAELLLGGCRWPIHGVLLRRSALERAGGFDESFRASADYDLWLRVASHGRLIRVPEVLAFYHHHAGEQITKNKLRSALNHHRAQLKFLRQNPGERARLGSARVRKLLYGELLRRAYASYWDRDLDCARALFRRVMRAGYGQPRDWLYMLPALLPINVHSWLLQHRDSRTR